MQRLTAPSTLARTWLLGLLPAMIVCGACKPPERPNTPESPITPKSDVSKREPSAPAPGTQPAPSPGHPPITPTTSPSAGTRPPVTTREAQSTPAPPPPPTVLEGITLRVPPGWKLVPPMPAPGTNIRPKAAFRLATSDTDPEPVVVRVSHFPEMRDRPNMVQENLERWYAKFEQPDRRPTAEVTQVETFMVGPWKVTLADIPGNTPAPVRRENQRMLGAIIEHPKGPFFVVAQGFAGGVERWKPSILQYIRSAEPNE